MRRDRRAGVRVLLALLVALLVHGLLLLVPLQRHRAAAPARTARPVVLVPSARQPITEPPAARARAPAQAPIEAPRRAAAEAPLEQHAEPAVVEPLAAEPPNGPRRVELFPDSAIGRGAAWTPKPTAPAAPRLSAEGLAEARVRSWDLRLAERMKSNVAIEKTRGLVDLEQRVGSWFLPKDESIENAGVEDVSIADILPTALFPLANPRTYDSEHPGAGRLLDDLTSRVTRTETRTVALLCWGACGQSHAVANLLAVVDVLHDERGFPAQWQLVRSSGDETFDASALEAIGDALDAAPDGMLAFERPAEWSRWSFASTAYEWSRDELVLDPQFEPPGKTLESKSGLSGLVTATREVRLVAVLYRDTARERCGGDPGRAGGDP